MNAPVSIDTLAAAWIQAKAEEDAARLRRLDIESQLVALLPAKPEGTVSAEAAGMKLTVTHKLTRKVDTAALQAAWNCLPPHAQACFKWSADVSAKELKACQGMDEQSYAAAARFITATPAKPAVKIERK